MFTIEKGKLLAKFGEDDIVSLELKDVKLDREALAMIALQRVSRETVAGLATDEPQKAKAKLVARWELWKQGTWESAKAAAPKLSEAELEEVAFDFFRFVCKHAGKPEYAEQVHAALLKKDKAATARWQQFKKDHAKQISKRVKETLKIRKAGVENY